MFGRSLSNLASTVRNTFRRNRRVENPESSAERDYLLENQNYQRVGSQDSFTTFATERRRLSRSRSEDYLYNENYYDNVPFERGQENAGGAERFPPGAGRFPDDTVRVRVGS